VGIGVTALLLSGGIDSVALAYWMRPRWAVTIDYGQRAAPAEITAARHVTAALEIPHEVLTVDCAALGTGDMAGSAALPEAPVPEWWPYRNQLLVTLAGMKAIALGATELMVGSVISDATHIDGTRPFYDCLDKLMAMQEGQVRVTAPALSMTSTELVRRAGIGRDLLAWSHSCHSGPLACGDCRGCYKHQQVMEELYGEAY
jgi:7-cyano-7-deazaguanine synthase